MYTQRRMGQKSVDPEFIEGGGTTCVHKISEHAHELHTSEIERAFCEVHVHVGLNFCQKFLLASHLACLEGALALVTGFIQRRYEVIKIPRDFLSIKCIPSAPLFR